LLYSESSCKDCLQDTTGSCYNRIQSSCKDCLQDTTGSCYNRIQSSCKDCLQDTTGSCYNRIHTWGEQNLKLTSCSASFIFNENSLPIPSTQQRNCPTFQLLTVETQSFIAFSRFSLQQNLLEEHRNSSREDLCSILWAALSLCA
jgi:hypothetical protein